VTLVCHLAEGERARATVRPVARDEAEVLAANAAFYEAFSSRDITGMLELWSQERDVVCIHPGWQILRGRASVSASWRAILSNPESPRVRAEDARALFLGDTAIVTCAEVLFEGVLAATNVFAREAGTWKLVAHQAGPARTAPATRDDGELLN